MSQDFRITDYIVQVADDALARLLLGFECETESKSASGVAAQEPICSIFRSQGVTLHGVESLTPAHPVSHVLGMTRDVGAVIMADDLFERITVRARGPEGKREAMLLGIYSRLAYFRTLFMHGALIHIPDYGGVMFIGPSGVGKTTQAVLWNRLRGADIINGDKVFLGLREDRPGELLAYGSPWTGSSPYCINRRVPLRAIIHLTRSPEKGIRRLSELEGLSVFATATFLPSWDARLTERVMDSMNDMLPLAPIYDMSCEPDESAVDMVAQALLGGR